MKMEVYYLVRVTDSVFDPGSKHLIHVDGPASLDVILELRRTKYRPELFEIVSEIKEVEKI